MTNKIRKSCILAEVHETATGLHQAGVIRKRRMHEYDALSNLTVPVIGNRAEVENRREETQQPFAEVAESD